VRDIETTLSITERARKAGLYAVVDEKNQPKATMGIVLVLGTDPFLEENGLAVGKRVHFNHLAGSYQYIKGERYRVLEFQELVGIDDPEEGEAPDSTF
jgi:co-chaperonin GroES (HSP10)